MTIVQDVIDAQRRWQVSHSDEGIFLYWTDGSSSDASPRYESCEQANKALYLRQALSAISVLELSALDFLNKGGGIGEWSDWIHSQTTEHHSLEPPSDK